MTPAQCRTPQRWRAVTWPLGPGMGGEWEVKNGCLLLHDRYSQHVEKLERAAEPLLGYEFLYAFDGAQDVYVTPDMLREFIGAGPGGGDGIPDAPNTGEQYMRVRGAWVLLTHIDGGSY